jgi:hypothetical protein
MGEAIGLHDQPARFEDDDELIESLARYADGTLSADQVKARHHLGAEAWAAMGENDRLVELVEAAKLRRLRSGATKRERAQAEVIDAPPILGKIMRSPDSNARHVVDAVKALDALATGPGSEAAAASARFEIKIILNQDVLQFSKSIEPNPADIDPFDTTNAIAAITTDKDKAKDDDSGGHI